MWLGEQITEHGIGNGISMIIFAGIVSRAPNGARGLYLNYSRQFRFRYLGNTRDIGILIMFVIVIAGVIWVQQAERRIPDTICKARCGKENVRGPEHAFADKGQPGGRYPDNICNVHYDVSFNDCYDVLCKRGQLVCKTGLKILSKARCM
jgi:hypothetical protein